MWRILGVVLVIALVAGGIATWRYDLLDRWLDDGPAEPAEPAAIAPPPGLELPPVDVPEAVARSASPSTSGPDRVRSPVSRTMAATA
jgi:serine-type D-Ala-D-Ala carboxypeptidase/endopeptidase (penicillin-binding protein 4)